MCDTQLEWPDRWSLVESQVLNLYFTLDFLPMIIYQFILAAKLQI